MTSLIEDIKDEHKPRGELCGVAKVLASDLSKRDREDLLEALLPTSQFTGAAVARALKKHGHEVAAGTVRRHRKGECGCPVVA